jgi:hypothetical protein
MAGAELSVSRRGRRRCGATVLWRIGSAALWLGVLGQGLSLRLGRGLLPFLDPDFWGYLSPALALRAGQGLAVSCARQFPYPLLLAGLLGVFDRFEAFAVVQMVASLLAGCVGAGCLLATADGRRPSGTVAAMVASLAFLAAYLNLPAPLVYERLVRPEGMAPLLMAAIAALGLAHGMAVRQGRNPCWPLFGMGALGAVCFFTKTSWGLALLLPVVAWLTAKALFAAGSSRALLGGVAGTLLVGLPMGGYQHWLDNRHDPGTGEVFVSETLFCMHAPDILKLIGDDLYRTDPPFVPGLLEPVRDMLDKELQRQKLQNDIFPYTSLGYNPDAIMYGSTGITSVEVFKALDSSVKSNFLMHYFIGFLKKFPGKYADKVLNQMALYYSFHSRAYQMSYCKFPMSALAGITLRILSTYSERALLQTRELQAYRQALETEAGQDWGMVPCVRGLTAVLNATFVPALLFALLAGIWRTRRRAGPDGGGLALYLAIVCLAGGFLVDLSTSLVHSLDINRYFEFHLVLTLLGQVAALLAAVSMLGHGQSRRWCA